MDIRTTDLNAVMDDYHLQNDNVSFLEADGCTNIHYEGINHMGLCDLSLSSPLIASILDGRLQMKNAGTQLMILNGDCINWIEDVL